MDILKSELPRRSSATRCLRYLAADILEIGVAVMYSCSLLTAVNL